MHKLLHIKMMKFMLIEKIDSQKAKNESLNHPYIFISFVEYKSNLEKKNHFINQNLKIMLYITLLINIFLNCQNKLTIFFFHVKILKMVKGNV